MKQSILLLKNETICNVNKVIDELKKDYTSIAGSYKIDIKHDYILLTILGTRIKIKYYKRAKYKRNFKLSYFFYRVCHPFKVSRIRRLFKDRPRYVALDRNDILSIIGRTFPKI